MKIVAYTPQLLRLACDNDERQIAKAPKPEPWLHIALCFEGNKDSYSINSGIIYIWDTREVVGVIHLTYGYERNAAIGRPVRDNKQPLKLGQAKLDNIGYVKRLMEFFSLKASGAKSTWSAIVYDGKTGRIYTKGRGQTEAIAKTSAEASFMQKRKDTGHPFYYLGNVGYDVIAFNSKEGEAAAMQKINSLKGR